MAFSGSTFTKLYNWATDSIGPYKNPKINAQRLDDEFAGIATGLTSLATAPTFSTSITGSFGGTSDFKIAATSNYNVVSLNNDTTIAGVLGIFGGASGDASALYLAAPGAVRMRINNVDRCVATAGGFSPAVDGAVFLGTSSLRWAGVLVKPYTVATLPSGTTGQIAYASDLRVFDASGTQQGAGSGTGGFVFYNGSAWKNLDAQAVTAAA